MIEAFAIGGGLGTLGALVAITVLAFKLIGVMNEREAARILASSTAGELVRAKDAITRLTKDLTIEQERADALDDELAETYDVPDPVGARDRVLAKWKLRHDAARGRAIQLPAPAAAARPGPDDLLNPFAD